jgi:hypothetical protein
MKNLKLITTLVLAFAFLFAQVGNVAAAPLAQDPAPITVVSITPETDADGVITVLVELEGGQIVRISEATAISLGLLQVDPVTNEPILDPVTGLPLAVVLDPNNPLSVAIPPGDIIADEEDVHPISAILAKFFGEEKASLIDQYHNDGFGFGVIAQALWMEKNLDGEFSFDAILDAKQSGNFSDFFPEDTENIPTNWGQFKKALRENDLLKEHNNLGNVVSGHAEEDQNSSTQSVHEKNKDKGNGKGRGNDNGHGHGNNRP